MIQRRFAFSLSFESAAGSRVNLVLLGHNAEAAVVSSISTAFGGCDGVSVAFPCVVIFLLVGPPIVLVVVLECHHD